MHDVSRSVCTYDSTYLDEMQCMCAYDDTSRLDVSVYISTSFLCSYSIWDDEWWWVSRLDLMMRSRLDLWDCVSISTRKSYQVSTRFYVWIWENFCPLGWQISRLMVRSLSPQHPDTFYKDWVQIAYRLLNQIIYAFIFKKPFFNWFGCISVSLRTFLPLKFLLDYLNRL